MRCGQLGTLGQHGGSPELTRGQRLPCPGLQYPRSQVGLPGLAGELVSGTQVCLGRMVRVQVDQARSSQQGQSPASDEQTAMLAQSGAGIQETPDVPEMRPDADE